MAPTAVLSHQLSTRYAPAQAYAPLQAPSISLHNDSGLGANAVLPAELNGWNWGAFLWTFVWGIGHRCWWSFLCLVPYVNLVMVFVMGVKGNQWAWQNRRWETVEQFRNTQRKWGYSAFISIAVVALLVIPLLAILGSRVETVFNTANDALSKAEISSPPVSETPTSYNPPSQTSEVVPSALPVTTPEISVSQLEEEVQRAVNDNLREENQSFTCTRVSLTKETDTVYKGTADFSQDLSAPIKVTVNPQTGAFLWELESS